MKKTLTNAAKKGRYGDDRLIHVSRHEIKGLEALAGGELPTNPDTGLKEAFFFLPFLFGAAAAPMAAAAAAPIAAGIGAAGAGAAGLAGLAGTATAGLGAAGAAGGLGALGAATTASALPAAATVASALPAATGLGAAGASGLGAAASALPAAASALPATSGLGALGTATTGAAAAAPTALGAPIIQGGGAASALGASAPLTVGQAPIISGAGGALNTAPLTVGTQAPMAIQGAGGALNTSPLTVGTSQAPMAIQGAGGALNTSPLIVGDSAAPTALGSNALATTNIPGAAYGGASNASAFGPVAGTPNASSALYPSATTPSALGGAAKAAPLAAKSTAPLATTNLPSVSYTGSGLPGSAAEAAGNAFPAGMPATVGGNTSGGLGSLMGGGSSSQIMQALGMMALMKGNGGGGGGKEKEKDVSGDKYNGGDPVFPSDGYQGGIDNEWDYFPNEHYYAQGGLVALAKGGQVKDPDLGLSASSDPTNMPDPLIEALKYGAGYFGYGPYSGDQTKDDGRPLQGYAKGGLVALAKGGRVPGPSFGKMPDFSGGKLTNDQSLIQETLQALQGMGNNPKATIAKFVKEFGPKALQDLLAKLQGGAQASQQAGQAQGQGLAALPQGDGQSDSIPAMINGKQPAALSEGEYVVPADVVSGLGNGATNAGVAALDQMNNNVRQARNAGGQQPAPVDPSQMMPGYACGGMVKHYDAGGPVAGGMGGAYGQGMSSFNAGLGGLAARMTGGMGAPPPANGGGGMPAPSSSMFTGQQVGPMTIHPQQFVARSPLPPQAQPPVSNPADATATDVPAVPEGQSLNVHHRHGSA
jgi:hypothetical protein